MKYYDIVLCAINEPKSEQKESCSVPTRDAVVQQLKRLAPESADFFDEGIFPIVLSRHATEEEKEFYKEFGVLNNCVIEAKRLKSSAFERFDSEVSLIEQDDDAHMLPKQEVLAKIEAGAKELREKEAAEDIFNEASGRIKATVMERQEMRRARFAPYSMLSAFALWAFMAAFIMVLRGVDETVITVMSAAFVTIIPITLLYDYVCFKKRVKRYFSPEGERRFWHELEELNKTKTQTILAVEDKIDRLEARKCMTVVRPEKRNLDDLSVILANGEKMSLGKIHEIICGGI